MIAIKLIQDVVEYERRLDVEKEQQRDRYTATFLNEPAPRPSTKKHASILERIFGNGRNRQPECSTC